MKNTRLDQEATRREMILAGLVLLAVLAAFLRLSYSPGAERLALFQTKVLSLQMERDALRKFQLATPTIPRARLSFQDVKLRVLLGDIRPRFDDLVTLMPRLTETSLLGGLALSGFRFLATSEETGYIRTDFELKTQGRFVDVIEYLERLERFPALFRIEDISLKREGSEDKISTEILGRFFRLQGIVGGKA